jgi:hypothetical protein
MLPDLHLLDLQIMDPQPYSGINGGQPSKRGTDSGQTSTYPETASLLPSVQTISEQDFKSNIVNIVSINRKT